MLRLLVLFVIMFPYCLAGQDDCHWAEVEDTPKSDTYLEYLFADGRILISSYASGELGISDDKGVTWRFNEYASNFAEARSSSFQEDLDGNFYYSTGYKQIHRVDRNSMETELVHLSNQQFFEFAVGKEHLYIADEGDIIVKHMETGETDTVVGGNGKILEINVDQEENILLITDSGRITVLDKELNEVSSSEFTLATQYDDIETTIMNHLIYQEDEQFYYSLDFGNSWSTEDSEGILFYDIYQGNNTRYFIEDSIVYSYDLLQEAWLDTIVTNTRLNGEGASDYLYISPGWTSYPDGLYYVNPTNGLSIIDTKVGQPDVYHITALNDSVFFLHDENLLHINGEYTPSHAFRNIHQLSTGELIGSTSSKLLISWNGDTVFEELATPVPVIDGVTKDENDRLFIFRYDGIWISIDKGLTWIHECPPAYFPGFDVYERSIKPKASNLYYGLTDLNNVLVYDHNIDDVRLSIQNPNNNTFAIFQFEVDAFGNRYYNTRNKMTDEFILRKKTGGLTTTLNIPSIELNGSFALDVHGDVYIHDRKSIFKSKDGGDTWIDITSDLPSDLFINRISTGPDGSIYLACRNGNVFKCGESLPSATDDNHESSIAVFPNPAKDVIIVSMEDKQDTEVDIYNMMGQKISNHFLTKTDSRVDVSRLLPGMYVLHMVGTGASVMIQKR